MYTHGDLYGGHVLHSFHLKMRGAVELGQMMEEKRLTD